MSNIADQLAIIITADGEQAKRNLAEVVKAIEGVERAGEGAAASNGRMAESNRRVSQTGQTTVQSLVGMAARYLTLGSAAAGAYATIRQGLADAEDERLGLIRLQSVLESTGRTYEVTAGRIDAAAQVLEDDLHLDKQAVMDAMATVATYEGVASDLFDRIMRSSADMSYTFGSDIGSAIRDLGRVMEDPIQGLTRLRRQGIMVSREIEDQVSSLVEQNRLYDAQVLILDEIDAKVGGVAERMAEAAGARGLSAMWGKFVGEVGNTIAGGVLPVQKAIADMLDGATGYMEFRNQIRSIRSEIEGLSLEDALALDTGDLQDLLDGLEGISSMEDTAYGAQANTILHQLQREISTSGLVEALREELDLRASLADAEAAQARADEEAAEAAAERAAMIDEEMSATEDLAALYATTKEGQTASLEAQIASLEEARRADQEALAGMLSSGDVDAEVKAILDRRLAMYDAVLEQLRGELEDLTIVPEVDTGTVAEKILGMSASEFALDIPVSLDLDGRSEIEEVEEQLSSLRDAIVRLNDQKPVEEDALEQWKEDMDILVGRYDELSAVHADMTRQNELRAIAERELATLLSDEERQTQELRDYQQQLNELYEAKLINQEEFNELLDRGVSSLGRAGSELSGWDRVISDMGEEWSSFLESTFGYESIAKVMTDAFDAMGRAWAEGSDAGQAAMDVLGDFIEQALAQMSSMFVMAGLRVIIDGGMAGLGPGLALIAAGGVTGVAAAILGSSASAIDDSIMLAMNDELEARERLADSINSAIDTEYELLRRQLDRNLISEEAFREEAGDLQHEKDVADARTELSSSVLNRIEDLNAEYEEMSGWDRMWSRRDEEIKSDIATLQEFFNQIGTATEERLRELVETLEGMGVLVGNVPAFASGGEFVTDGPQLIMVGDNPSGRERVSITPLESGSGMSAAGPSTVIYITGDVYGLEDLYGKLGQVGLKMARRMR